MRRRDTGFTLVEVLIVAAVLGMLATVVSAAIIVVLRTSPQTTARVDDGRTLLGITTYLPGDVSSTPIRAGASGDDTSDGGNWDRDPSAAVPCSGYTEASGINVLSLSWTQLGTDYSAHYRYASVQAAPQMEWRLVRIYCAGGAANVVNLTAQLPAPADESDPADDPDDPTDGWLPVAAEWKTQGSDIVGAELTLETESGDSLRFDGASKNPDATLPPDLGGGGGGPTPTGCTATLNTPSPSSIPNQGNGTKKLQDPLTLTISYTGSCTGLGVEYDPQNSGVAHWAAADTSTNPAVVQIPSTPTQTWTEESHTLTARLGTQTFNSITVTVT